MVRLAQPSYQLSMAWNFWLNQVSNRREETGRFVLFVLAALLIVVEGE